MGDKSENSGGIVSRPPTGKLKISGKKPTVRTTLQYLVEHPYWMILTITIIVLPPMIGFRIGGVWSIFFGWATGIAGFYAGSKAVIKIIEDV